MGAYELSTFYALAKQVDHRSFHGLLICVTLTVVLLLWRFWTFTILPALHPNEPKEVPYWIPCEQISNPLATSVLTRSLHSKS